MQKILTEVTFTKKIESWELKNLKKISESHYQADWHGQNVVVMQLKKTTATTAQLNAALSFQHENVVTFIGYVEDSENYQVVRPYLSGESLKNFRINNKPDLISCIKIAKGILYGLAYLHSRDRIVESFAPEKILLTEHLIPQISGHALQFFDENIPPVWDDFPTKSASLTLQQKKEANIRSLGRILLFVFTGEYPEIKLGKYELRIPANIPEKIRCLIFRCLNSFTENQPILSELAEELQSCIENSLPKISSPTGFNISMPNPMTPEFKIHAPSAADEYMIRQNYALNPVENYNIKRIEMIQNLEISRIFRVHCENLESRANSKNADYRSNWFLSPGGKQRQESLQTFQQYASNYRVVQYPGVQIMPLWHGTVDSAVNSIFRTSLSIRYSENGAKFGRGVYLSPQAKYAGQYYASKKDKSIVLIFSYVAVYSVYSVQSTDSLQGAAINSPYDAHVIQVTDEDHPGEFDVCKVGQKSKFTEIVVSQEAACYPFAKVTLQYSQEQNGLIHFIPNPTTSSRKELLDYLQVYSSCMLDFGTYFVSGHLDGRLKIWHADTAVCKIWPIHQHAIVKLEWENNCIRTTDEQGQTFTETAAYYGITSDLNNKPAYREDTLIYSVINKPQDLMVNIDSSIDKIKFAPMVIPNKDLKNISSITLFNQIQNSGDYFIAGKTNRISFFGSILASKKYKNISIDQQNSYLMHNFYRMRILHPNLVSIRGLSEASSSKTFIIIPYFERGTLENHLQRESNEITDSQKIEWMLQLAAGLSALHKNGLAHRYLTLRDILVQSDGSIALGSFGDAHNPESVASTAGTNGEKTNDIIECVSFRAPETFTIGFIKLKEDLKANQKADVFSFLLLCQAILLRKRPSEFQPIEQLIRLASHQLRYPEVTLSPWKNSKWGNLLCNLILEYTKPTAIDTAYPRPSMEEIYQKLVEIKQQFYCEVSVLPLGKQAPKRWTQSQKFVETSLTLWPEERRQMEFLLAFQNPKLIKIEKIEGIVSNMHAAAFRSRQQILARRIQDAPQAFRESWLAHTDPFAEERKMQKNHFQNIVAIAAHDPVMLTREEKDKLRQMIRPIPFWLIVDESDVNRILHGDFPLTNDRYGRGIYGSLECRPIKGKVAIFCAANIRAPYPILPQDKDFTGRRNYDNSDAHIVFQESQSTVVLFETKDIEPRFIIWPEQTEENIPSELKKPWLSVEEVLFPKWEKPKEQTPIVPQAPEESLVKQEKLLLSQPSFFSQPKISKAQDLHQTIELGRQFIIRIASDKPNTFKILNCFSAEETFIEAHNKPILGMKMIDEENFISYDIDAEKIWEMTEYGPREKLNLVGVLTST
jgi:serine/threonine protein kinase